MDRRLNHALLAVLPYRLDGNGIEVLVRSSGTNPLFTVTPLVQRAAHLEALDYAYAELGVSGAVHKRPLGGFTTPTASVYPVYAIEVRSSTTVRTVEYGWVSLADLSRRLEGRLQAAIETLPGRIRMLKRP